MKKLSLLLILCAAAGVALGQKDDDSERRENIRESVRLARSERAKSPVVENSLTVAEVGDPDSFGKNAKFLGTATTGFVYIYYSCDPAILLAELELTLGADDRCLAAPTPGVAVNGQFNDIGRITIPGRSADNVFFFLANNLVNYDLLNPNPTPVSSSFLYSPTITLESVALNDPAAIDPGTGLPMNGSYTTGINGTKLLSKTLAGNAFENTFERYASTSSRGFARSFFADLGLPQNVINKIYNKPLTIKLNIRVRTNYTTFGQFNYAMRILAN